MKLRGPSVLLTNTDINLAGLQRFVRERLLPYEAETRETSRFELELYRELHGQGFMQMSLPKTYGGSGARVIDIACVGREIAYGSLSAGGTFLGNLLGQSGVSLYGSEELKAEVLGRYAGKFSLWSFAMSEEEVGSDLSQTRTVARETSGGYLLSGEKNFITNASYSEQMIVFARVLDIGGNDRGITAFYLLCETPGVRRGDTLDKTAWRRANTGTLHFDNAFVPHAQRLGAIGEGLKVLGRCLNRSKTVMAAMGVGLAARALDLAQEHLAATNRFGKRLIDQPAIRHLLARLHTQNEAAWLLTCQACEAWENGRGTKEASMAKLFAGNVAVDITNECVELLGSRGLFSESEMARLYRDAKSLEIIEGPSFLQELMIAKEILPKAPSAPALERKSA